MVAAAAPLSFRPEEGRVFGLAGELVRLDQPLDFGIDQGYIGNRPGFECTAIKARIFEGLHDIFAISCLRLSTPSSTSLKRQRQRCFQPDNAVHGDVELHVLFVQMVRRMVGGNGIDGAVFQPFLYGGHVIGLRSGGFILALVL